MDPFVGVGGNLIQFATHCGYAVGVDIDPTKCNYTHNNATLYGLSEQNFKVLHADFLDLDPSNI